MPDLETLQFMKIEFVSSIGYQDFFTRPETYRLETADYALYRVSSSKSFLDARLGNFLKPKVEEGIIFKLASSSSKTQKSRPLWGTGFSIILEYKF